MVKMVAEYRNINQGTLTIACDNDSSLDAGTMIYTSSKTNPSHFDLIWEVSDLLKTLPISVIKKNVKDHAEDFKIHLNK